MITVTPHRYAGGILLAVLAALAYSAKAIFVKLSFRHGIDPVTLLVLRLLFSAPVFLALVLLNSRLRKEILELSARDWFQIVIIGLLGSYLASILDFWGLQYVTASLERILLFTYPGMVLLISAAAFHQPVRSIEIFALALCFAGVALSFYTELPTAGPQVLLGGSLILACALSYALYIVGAGRLLTRMSVMLLTCFGMLVSTAAIVVHFLVTKPVANLNQPREVYILVGWMALFSTVLPSFFLAASISRIGSNVAAIVSSIGPVSSIVLANLFLGEPITLTQTIGGLLVIGGVLMISRKPTEVAESEVI